MEASEIDLVDRALLISIQPRFAAAILDGTKTIELRRTVPTLPPSARALIYASSPTKALVGWATIEEVLQASPGELWRTQGESTGVTAAEFDEYFTGKSDAFGFRLTDVERADSPVNLTAMRDVGLEPPQSWRYVTTELALGLCHAMVATSRLASSAARPQPALTVAR